jgi:hypothetical protein
VLAQDTEQQRLYARRGHGKIEGKERKERKTAQPSVPGRTILETHRHTHARMAPPRQRERDDVVAMADPRSLMSVVLL